MTSKSKVESFQKKTEKEMLSVCFPPWTIKKTPWQQKLENLVFLHCKKVKWTAGLPSCYMFISYHMSVSGTWNNVVRLCPRGDTDAPHYSMFTIVSMITIKFISK